MTGEADNQGWTRRWGLPASVAAHVLIAVLVIFGLPLPQLQPQEEQSISVTIEPPPEPPKKARQEAPKQAKPTPPPAEAVKPPPAQGKPARQPMPTLDDVVKFGEKDAGSRRQLDGSAAEDNSAPPTQLPVVEEQKAAAEAKPESPAEDKPQSAETDGAESARPSQPEDEAAENAGAPVNQLTTTAPGSPEKAVPAERTKPSTPKKANTAKPSSGAKLQKARTLFSRSASGDPIAETAMANLPRGTRAGRLCATELRLQLLNAVPPHFPDLLPYFEPKTGTILKVPEAAFRARGEWYNLNFECQVDAGATRVVSFAFRVGETMSVRELERRGLAPGQ